MDGSINLYLHIPFCAKRCTYCDFYTQTNQKLKEVFLDALCCELQLRRQELGTQRVQNIYLGGGTPSLLTSSDLERIFKVISLNYEVDPSAEITIECNPDDLSEDYVRAFNDLPINRVSMGVQSFKDEDLKFLNRRHSVKNVYDAVERLKANNYHNISLDLIYGLPNQSLNAWSYNIDEVLALDIPHLSAYHLIYEEGTVLMKQKLRGEVQELSEDESLAHFRLLITKLKQHGYEHYEISNFAKDQAYARLNTGYWFGVRYLGFGPSAHSYDGAKRRYNNASIKKYSEILEGQRYFEEEVLSPQEKEDEYIMTRLRTMWGINLQEFEELFGLGRSKSLLASAKKHISLGQLSYEEGRLCLTDEGIFLSDSIIVDLFA